MINIFVGNIKKCVSIELQDNWQTPKKKKKTLEPILNPKHNLLKCVKIELVTFKTCKISFDCKENLKY